MSNSSSSRLDTTANGLPLLSTPPPFSSSLSLPITICPLAPSLPFSSTPHHQSIWTCCNFPQITIRTRLVWTQLPSIPLISPLFYPCLSINLEMQGIRMKWVKLGISIRVHFNKSQLFRAGSLQVRLEIKNNMKASSYLFIMLLITQHHSI